MIHHRGRLETPRWRREKRGVWARVIVSVAVMALAYSLVKIQVVRAEEFVAQARENMLKPVTVRAPRGTIYDRHGAVVAENRVAYQVQLMPAPLDTLQAQVEALRPVLHLTDNQIQMAFRKYQVSPNRPMVVLSDAPMDAVARLEERRREFQHVLLHEYPKRYYPAGPSVAHLVGYVAEISEQELADPRFAGYSQGRWIGKGGLERQYEHILGGEPGYRYLEVDARGGIKRWLPESLGAPPIPGQDLHLALDLDLQRYVVQLFRDYADTHGGGPVQGAFVAMDPRTGGILAYYSHPNYDANLFTGGIASDVWRGLNEDPAKPLLDRVTGDAQPPGSTFKMSVAAMALAAGVIRADELMPIACSGGMSYQNRYARCWTTHGIRMDLPLGIKNSCDVYFYQVGIRMGLEQYMEIGSRLGFGTRTGIDLPSEISPIFPQDKDWFRKRFGYVPPDNEVMSLSIGQGAVTLTPLKLAQVVAGFARPDGRMPVPRIAQTSDPTQFQSDYGISTEQLAAIRSGMRRVLGPGGTAWLSRLPHWDVYGKTGTAQNSLGADHGWFVGVGAPPGKEPEIVASILIYAGEHGSSVSGVAMGAINFYLNRRYGRPFVRFGSPREQQAQGVPVDWSALMRPVEDYPVRPYNQ